MASDFRASDVAAWRRETGLCQDDFARLLGISRPTVARWEGGGRSVPAWVGLAYAGWRSRQQAESSTLRDLIRAEITRMRDAGEV